MTMRTGVSARSWRTKLDPIKPAPPVTHQTSDAVATSGWGAWDTIGSSRQPGGRPFKVVCGSPPHSPTRRRVMTAPPAHARRALRLHPLQGDVERAGTKQHQHGEGA